jgi:hypothetical protein
MKSNPDTKYIRMEVDFWYNEDKDEIHITSPDSERFHTTVNNKEGSIRCHKNLYEKLAEILRKENKHP